VKIFSGPTKRISKKGSLQLSINAIVILVMAITLLSLGLGFIRSIFSGTVKDLVNIKPDELTAPATADNPISLEEGNKITVKQGEENQEFVFSFYNTKANTANEVKFTIEGCEGSGLTRTVTNGVVSYATGIGSSAVSVTVPTILTTAQNVAPGKVAPFVGLLNSGSFPPALYVCNIIAKAKAGSAPTFSEFAKESIFLNVVS